MPFFLSHMGRKSGSGTTMATRHDCNAAEWKRSSRTAGESGAPAGREDSYLQAVAVDEDLGHRVAQGVHGLDLLRRDVFPLRQLENVLLPVRDLQSAVLQRDTAVSDVTRRFARHPSPT